MRCIFQLTMAACAACLAARPLLADEPPAGIEIAELAVGVEVEFAKDVLPALKQNCIACHNPNAAESDVLLDTPESILAYDAGDPLIVPGDPSAGKLLAVAAQQQEPTMPPAENDVGARSLSPAELGALKRWIELGAKATSNGLPQSVQRMPLDADRQPITAAEVAEYPGAYISARGNSVEVHDRHGATAPQQLIDSQLVALHPEFRQAAHLDVVRSLAISTDGRMLATGGYRTVKLWRRQRGSHTVDIPDDSPSTAWAASTDGWVAIGRRDGSIQLVRVDAASPEAAPVSWVAHDGPIARLQFTSTGERLASVAEDGVVHAWQVVDRKPLGSWKIAAPFRLAELVGDEHLVTAADDLTLRVWQLTPGADQGASPDDKKSDDQKTDEQSGPLELEPVRLLKGHGREIMALARVRDDPGVIFSGGKDGFIRLWDVAEGVERGRWIHGAEIAVLAVDAAGKTIVSVDALGTAKAWTPGDVEAQWVRPVHHPLSRRLSFAEQSLLLAEENSNAAAEALTAAEEQLATDQKKHDQAAQQLAEAAKEHGVAEQASEKSAALHQAAAQAGAKVQQLGDLAAKIRKRAAELSPALADQQADVDSLIRLTREIASLGLEQSSDEHGLLPALEEATESFAALEQAGQRRRQFGEQLEALLAAAAQQGEVPAARLEELAKRAKQDEKTLADAREVRDKAAATVRRAAEGVAGSQAVVQQAKDAAVSAGEAVAHSRDAAQQAQQELHNVSPIRGAAFDHGGEQLLFSNAAGELFLFRADGNAVDDWRTASSLPAGGALFASDNRVIALATGADQAVRVWDAAAAWRPEAVIGGAENPESPLAGRVLALDFSPDGRRLAIGGGGADPQGQIVIWDLEASKQHLEFERPHSEVVFAVDFSRDGKYVASASADGMMKVFRVTDGKWIRSFEGHTHYVLDVAWRANGRQLATSGADKAIKVWDFETGEAAHSFAPAAGKEVTAIDFLAASGQFASVAGDGVVRIHDADKGQQLRTMATGGDYLFCCAASDAHGEILVGGAGRILRVFNSADGKERLKIPAASADE